MLIHKRCVDVFAPCHEPAGGAQPGFCSQPWRQVYPAHCSGRHQPRTGGLCTDDASWGAAAGAITTGSAWGTIRSGEVVDQFTKQDGRQQAAQA